MGVLVGMVLFGAASTAVAEIEVTGDANVGIYSKYIWRGFDLLPNDNYSIQTGANISAGGFTYSFWGAIEQKNSNLYEADLILDYTHNFGELVSASIGNIMYDVENIRTTNEVYLAATVNTLLSPSLAIYWDYDELKTVYSTLGVSHDLDLADNVSLGLGLQISYFADDPKGLGTTESWFHNVEIPVNLTYSFTDQVSVDASFLYSGPLSDEARNIAGLSDEYVGGLSTTLAF